MKIKIIRCPECGKENPHSGAESLCDECLEKFGPIAKLLTSLDFLKEALQFIEHITPPNEAQEFLTRAKAFLKGMER